MVAIRHTPFILFYGLPFLRFLMFRPVSPGLLPGIFIQALPHGRPFFLPQCVCFPCLGKKQIHEPGIAFVHNKIPVPVTAKAVRGRSDRDRFRPCPVAVGNAPVLLLLLHRIGRDIKHPLIAKLLQHLIHTGRIQAVIPVVVGLSNQIPPFQNQKGRPVLTASKRKRTGHLLSVPRPYCLSKYKIL